MNARRFLIVLCLLAVVLVLAGLIITSRVTTRGDPNICEKPEVSEALTIDYENGSLIACVTSEKQQVSLGWNGARIIGFEAMTFHPVGERIQVKLITRIELATEVPFVNDVAETGISLKPGDVVKIKISSDSFLPGKAREVLGYQRAYNSDSLAQSNREPAVNYDFAPIRIAPNDDDIRVLTALPPRPVRPIPDPFQVGNFPLLATQYDPSIWKYGGFALNKNLGAKITKVGLGDAAQNPVPIPIWQFQGKLVFSMKPPAGAYSLYINYQTGGEYKVEYIFFSVE